MADSKKSLGDFIRTFYFYFFAGVGLVLLIVGVFQLSQWGVKSFVLPKYDLNYEETRCEFLPTKAEAEPSIISSATSQSKEDCLVRLEEQRKTRQITDLAQAITFVVIGGAVFLFHFKRTSLLHK